MDTFDFASWSQACLLRVEQALSDGVGVGAPAGLGEAMRYAVLDGGKRLRPLLVLAARQAVAVADGEASASAGFDEASAARSLRGGADPCLLARARRHALHGQRRAAPRQTHSACAVSGRRRRLLAGDALQALAFELLAPEGAAVPEPVQARLCRLLARAAGAQGMAGGQAIDLAHVGCGMTEDALRHMHRLKTGALLQASVLMGAHCGNAAPAALQALADYGAALGLAFQVVDDILDVTQDSATLGKTAGKDAEQGKPTYVSLLGLERAQAYARELLVQALAALDAAALPDTRALAALAQMVVNRSH
jgi:farnesyl diphosphate synthase